MIPIRDKSDIPIGVIQPTSATITQDDFDSIRKTLEPTDTEESEGD